MNRGKFTGEKFALEAIDQTREAHILALNKGDAEAGAALFTDDGVQMPPHMPSNIGRAVIRTSSQVLADHYHSKFALTVDEVRVTADWAFESGGYTNKLTPHAGGPCIEDVGKYIMIYQRELENTWRIAYDIWNSDLPPV